MPISHILRPAPRRWKLALFTTPVAETSLKTTKSTSIMSIMSPITSLTMNSQTIMRRNKYNMYKFQSTIRMICNLQNRKPLSSTFLVLPIWKNFSWQPSWARA